MLQHILVPLDGSLRAERAVPIAARIARATSGSVHLVQVILPPIDYSGGLAPAPLMSEHVIFDEMARAIEYLQAVASRHLSGVETTTEVMFGIPAQCILASAAERGIDLIVLRSHGRTGFARWALGSVAHTLAHESAVPTLILREGDSASTLADSPTTRPLCALVPLDGSELAEAALLPAAYLAAALASPASGALHLLQVLTSFSEPTQEGEATRHDEAEEQASRYLTHVVERLQATMKELHLSITWSVLSEEHDVAYALVKRAEQAGESKKSGGTSRCDLVAISTHGRHGISRWVMGSVTDRVLSATKLPMLIVRPQPQR